MTRMRTKLVKNLTDEEAKKLRRLTKGSRMQGGMQRWFYWLRAEAGRIPEEFAPRVWWYEQDGRVLAWAMAHYATVDGSSAKEGWKDEDQGWWGNIYVRKGKSGEYRRRGYGSRLLARMVSKHPDLHVSPYNHEARSFYAANGFDRLLTGYSLVRS